MRRLLNATQFGALVFAALLVAGNPSAGAFDVPVDEKTKLSACELSLCEIIVKKESSGPDLTCDIQKTWAGDKIKKGIIGRTLNWSLGDARCGMQVNVKRADFLAALNQPEYELKFPETPVKCDFENEDKSVSSMSFVIAPSWKFKAGKAESAALGIGKIEASTVVLSAIWTAQKLDETFGVFQGSLVADVNEFIETKCPEKVKK